MSENQTIANSTTPLSPGKLTLLYGFFALIATIINIGAQDISIRIYSGDFGIYFSIFVGTLAGLVTKYVLDKRYIFRVETENLNEDSKLFVLYTSMGIITTLIFWGTELLFDYIFETKAMRYLGGVIGLAIGYMIKYFLDRRFVFNKAKPRANPVPTGDVTPTDNGASEN